MPKIHILIYSGAGKVASDRVREDNGRLVRQD